MRNARIDSTQDLEGQPVVSACFDLSDEEVVASAHAIRTMSAERYRTADLSADDVLILRELTAIADELDRAGRRHADGGVLAGAPLLLPGCGGALR